MEIEIRTDVIAKTDKLAIKMFKQHCHNIGLTEDIEDADFELVEEEVEDSEGECRSVRLVYSDSHDTLGGDDDN